MNIKLIATAALSLALLQGCASGIRVGGERAGVEAGAVLGTPASYGPPTHPDRSPPERLPEPDSISDTLPGR